MKAVHVVLQHIMAHLLEPVCQVDSDQVAELGVCQRYVRAAGHIRPGADAVLARAVGQRGIQGCAVHDTVAEGTELRPLQAHVKLTRAPLLVQQGPASYMLCRHSTQGKIINPVEQSCVSNKLKNQALQAMVVCCTVHCPIRFDQWHSMACIFDETAV